MAGDDVERDEHQRDGSQPHADRVGADRPGAVAEEIAVPDGDHRHGERDQQRQAEETAGDVDRRRSLRRDLRKNREAREADDRTRQDEDPACHTVQGPEALAEGADELHGAGDPESDAGQDMGKQGDGRNGQMGAVFGQGAGRHLEHENERIQDRDGGQEGQEQGKRDRSLKEAEHAGFLGGKGSVVAGGEDLVEADAEAAGDADEDCLDCRVRGGARRNRRTAHDPAWAVPASLPKRYGANCTDEIVLFLPFQSSNDAYVPSPLGPPVLLTTQLPPS